MPLKIYGLSLSTCTRRVAVVCKEKGIPYELISVDLTKGDQKAPSFTTHQPFGQVPYIDDDGFILYESRAIGRYLAKKYADQGTPNLVPAEPKAEALFEQAVSIEISNFDPFASKIGFERVFKLFYGRQTDEARVAELATTLNAKLDGYEAILGKQKYLAGDNLTLADLFHLPAGSTLLGPAGYAHLLEKRPNVARWWNDISSRPAWLAVKDGA
ncbi:glutathione S-transferase [Leucogyrophana mollusca]|uniref:Glutathione S-transferase n=1 Tax=Leucogyrophana mollusca TaxID=85980 RepID=A0ACB8BA35_9AGAM|nr:glutathione S-transferase [Leucogyrophana mollusca]